MSILADKPGHFPEEAGNIPVYHSYRTCAKCGKGFVGKTTSKYCLICGAFVIEDRVRKQRAKTYHKRK